MPDNLTILIPYRDRFQHLLQFVPHILNFLKDQCPTLLIIEQVDNRPFNRGALLNAGFQMAPNDGWFAFHDIDMLPVDKSCDYSKPKGVCHLAGSVEQFGFGTPYLNYCGGVLLTVPSVFQAVNGFSNRYWGWGCEDDDLFLRFWRTGIHVERRTGRYCSLPHWRSAATTTVLANHEILTNVLRSSAVPILENIELEPRSFRRAPHGAYAPLKGAEELSSCDGLSTLKYNIMKRHPLQSYANFNLTISSVHEVIGIEFQG